MKRYYIGKEYVFYESEDEPKTLNIEINDKYKICKSKKDAESQQRVCAVNNAFLLGMMEHIIDTQYKGWKINEIDNSHENK